MAVVTVPVTEVLLPRVQRASRVALATKEKWRTKAGRCLFSVVFRNVDLIMFTVGNTKYLTLARLTN